MFGLADRSGIRHEGRDAFRSDPKTLAETDGQADGYQEFLLALRDQVIAFAGRCLRTRRFTLLPGRQPFLTPRGGGWRTLRAWKLSATMRKTASTTCTGSR